MPIGSKLKELRSNSKMTQKELADKLCVSYQAVSRWENDEAEPSIDTLRQLSDIFNCSLDELFGKETKDTNNISNIDNNINQNSVVEVSVSDTYVREEPQVVEKIVYKEQKAVLAVCEKCNSPIYDSQDIKRFETKVRHGYGRNSSYEILKHLYCTKCNNARLKAIQEEKQRQLAIMRAEFKKKRMHHFIWSPLFGAILFLIGIPFMRGVLEGLEVSGNNYVLAIIVGVLGMFFMGCCILGNNFIPEMWVSIAKFSFIRMPGLITTFDIDGLIWVITMKVLFFLLGIALAIIMFFIATIITFALSLFVYPFALAKNIKYEY